jgi:hypothetical protein
VTEEAIYYATQMKVDCIVTGTRSQGALKRFFLGSFSSYMLNNSPCDILIVKADSPNRHTTSAQECSIAADAYDAHRSLHEGQAGAFSGHSACVPSSISSSSSTSTHIDENDQGNQSHKQQQSSSAPSRDDGNKPKAVGGDAAAATTSSGGSSTPMERSG